MPISGCHDLPLATFNLPSRVFRHGCRRAGCPERRRGGFFHTLSCARPAQRIKSPNPPNPSCRHSVAACVSDHSRGQVLAPATALSPNGNTPPIVIPDIISRKRNENVRNLRRKAGPPTGVAAALSRSDCTGRVALAKLQGNSFTPSPCPCQGIQGIRPLCRLQTLRGGLGGRRGIPWTTPLDRLARSAEHHSKISALLRRRHAKIRQQQEKHRLILFFPSYHSGFKHFRFLIGQVESGGQFFRKIRKALL